MTEPYRDASRPIDERLDDLLRRMTLEEKLAQIGCVWSTQLLDEGRFSPALAKRWMPHGIGHVTRIGGATVLGPNESAAFANEIQRHCTNETRLGIPAVIHEESCAGFMAKGATCFPQAIGLAGTFDAERVEAMARVIREQMLAVGARHSLAPVLDVARDPRWGRVEETFGEDPWLIAQMGIAYVRGLQGDDLRGGVIATGKHFAGYAASEGGLNWAPAHLGPRELRDLYAFPFEAAIREAGLASVMNGYHELDGIPCGASKALLDDLLRGELGFEGVVVADYFTVDCLRSYHRIAPDKGEAARRALAAGLDVELPAFDCFGEPLRDAVARGAVPLEQIDRAVRRMLRAKILLGVFERPFVDEGAAARVFDTSAQRALARTLAQRSIVLLSNQGGVLPLRRNLVRLAVIGPSADSIRVLQGDYHFPSHLETMFGAIDEHLAGNVEGAGEPAAEAPAAPNAGETNLAAHFPRMTTLLDGIRERVSPETEILEARGCEIAHTGTEGFADAVAVARAAEVAIVCVGGKSGLVAGCSSGESVDRCTLGLPGVQELLIEAVISTGTPTIVVVVDGRPLALAAIAEHAHALLHAWLPGEEAGHALADVLFGLVNPSGRLAVSMPRTEGQLPVFHGHRPSGGRSHWKGAYADGPATPLFAFGHGLSYTRFEYSELALSRSRAGAGEQIEIACEVRNAGSRAGEEVAQLYVHDLVGSVTRPIRELRGFARIPLAPGERKRVVFELAIDALTFLDESMRLVVEPGEIEVMLGASSVDIRLRGRFEIDGEAPILRPRRVFTTPVRIEPVA